MNTIEIETAFSLVNEALSSYSDGIKKETKFLVDEGSQDAVNKNMSYLTELDLFKTRFLDLKNEFCLDFCAKENNLVCTQPDLRVSNITSAQIYEMKHKSARAKAEFKNEKFTILPGSTIIKESLESLSVVVKKQKEKAIENGEIILNDEENLHDVVAPINFTSPSAAAAFVGGCSLNGPETWKERNSGFSFGDVNRNNKLRKEDALEIENG